MSALYHVLLLIKRNILIKRTESSLRIICFEKGSCCGGLFRYFHIKRIGVPLYMATLTSTHPSYEGRTRRTNTFTTISNLPSRAICNLQGWPHKRGTAVPVLDFPKCSFGDTFVVSHTGSITTNV